MASPCSPVTIYTFLTLLVPYRFTSFIHNILEIEETSDGTIVLHALRKKIVVQKSELRLWVSNEKEAIKALREFREIDSTEIPTGTALGMVGETGMEYLRSIRSL